MKIKTGNEILEDFFESIKGNKNLNTEVVDALIRLYKNNEFRKSAIDDNLQKIRHNDENKINNS